MCNKLDLPPISDFTKPVMNMKEFGRNPKSVVVNKEHLCLEARTFLGERRAFMSPQWNWWPMLNGIHNFCCVSTQTSSQ